MVKVFVSGHDAATAVRPHGVDPSIIPEEAIGDLDRALMEGKLLHVVPVARKVLQTASRSPVSIAVTGDSGNGMSSFINALRCIGHEEEGSAPTGVVRTTQTPARYCAPNFPHVELWDLPGMGATGQSVERYVQDMGFSRCDLIVLVASEQFSCNHVGLAAAMQALGKRFYVVWTKLDRDLSTSTHSETELWQNIREHIRLSLQKERVQEPPIFLVSSLEPSSHDFQRLREMLSKDLCSIRCHGPLESLSQICEKAIDSLVASKKANIDTENFPQYPEWASRAAYEQLFGVDEQSLRQLAQYAGRGDMAGKEVMPLQCTWSSYLNDFVELCYSGMGLLLTGLDYVPYIGNYTVSWRRYWDHRHELDLVADKTKQILKEVLKGLPCSEEVTG